MKLKKIRKSNWLIGDNKENENKHYGILSRKNERKMEQKSYLR